MRNKPKKQSLIIVLFFVCVLVLVGVFITASLLGLSFDPQSFFSENNSLSIAATPMPPPQSQEPKIPFPAELATEDLSDPDAESPGMVQPDPAPAETGATSAATGAEPETLLAAGTDAEPDALFTAEFNPEPDTPGSAQHDTESDSAAGHQSQDPRSPPDDEPEEFVITSLPVRVRIPALSLDYPIQSMGADESGTMQIAPALAVTSWFDRSAIPGNKGNAILGGHNTWRGVQSRLFNLYDLRIGDEMEIVYADGTSLTFRLESVFIYALRSAPAHLIMDVRGEARVTLITCKGPYNRSIGTSDNRIVATFKEESVFVIPDPPVRAFPPVTPEWVDTTFQQMLFLLGVMSE